MSLKFFAVPNRFSLSNLSSLQLFQLIRYAGFLFIGIGFAKLHLPLSEIGAFETFIMISGLVSFFWISGIINTMMSVYPKKDSQKKKELLFNTFVTLIFFSAIAANLLLTFSQNILQFLDKTGTGNISGLACFYLLLNGPSFLNEYILYLNEKKRAIIYYACISSVLTISAALIPVMLNYPVEYSLYGLILVAALKFISILFLLNRYAAFVFSAKEQLENFKLSLPLLLSIFVSGSAEYIDGVIVKSKFDDVSFALFRYGAKELPVLLIVANTFSTAMIPVVAASLHEGLAQIKNKSRQLMHIFFPLSMLLMMVSPLLYRYAFNENFIYSALIFNLYLLLIIPRVLFPQTILTGLQKTKYLLISSLIEISINVSLSIYLAGKLGMPGIAIGTLVAYSIDKIFLIGVNHYVYGIRPSSYIPATVFIPYLLGALLAFGIGFSLLKTGFWG